MTCDELAISLTEAALDLEGEDAALHEHVEGCSACRDELALLRGIAGRVRAARPDVHAPAEPSPIHPGLAVAWATLVAVIFALLVPALFARSGPIWAPPSPPSRPEAVPADARLGSPEVTALFRQASLSALEAVERENARFFTLEATVAEPEPEDVALPESTDLEIERLDGPAVERALALLR